MVAAVLAFSVFGKAQAVERGFEVAALPGIVVDDASAELIGNWSKSTHTKGYVAEGYQYCPPEKTNKAVFKLPVTVAGKYQVLVSHTPGTNRSATALVKVHAADGEKSTEVDQQQAPAGPGIFQALGEFTFDVGNAVIEISAEKTEKGVVIVDAVQLLTAEQFADAKKAPATSVVAAKPTKPAPKTPAPSAKPKPPAPVIEPPPPFVRRAPTKPVGKLTVAELDRLLAAHLGDAAEANPAADDAFLRRLSFDLIGRQPTPEEMHEFLADESADKRARAIERLLASPLFGENWANYWSDVISYRTPQPELTFLNYQPLKQWLAEEFNRGTGWDEVAYDLLTASGKVGDNPAATFIGFHQGDKSRLAAETTRVFLSTQIQCAECHDHKFIEMPQETFHHVAAFFVRVDAKLPWNDSGAILVSSKPKGEHKMPSGKQELAPEVFGQTKLEIGASDIQRRAALADWIVSGDNPWFAKALTNRVWARMLGRGFCEPVDEIGELGDSVLPEVHAALAGHFVAGEHDFRDLVRLIANTHIYQRAVLDGDPAEKKPFATIAAGKLRGDEVFDSLARAIDLPNVTPPAMKPTAEVRFPPPPKSTRDLVNEAFGYDPSSSRESVVRSLQQAMLLMNNRQIQKQIDASPGADTMLAKLLAAETDDIVAVERLYENVLARKPNLKEREIAARHLAKLGDRKAAYEDLLWSLVNSAEFVSRR
jgi:hypothetical protein